MMLLPILSGFGLAVSLMTLKRQGRYCAGESDDAARCDAVIRTPQAALFAGVPNSIVGIAWYSVLLLWSVTGLFLPLPAWSGTLIILAAAASFGISVYLMIMLLFVLRQACPLCYTAHGINAAILLVLLW
jgi:uncharacterized membrane protein